MSTAVDPISRIEWAIFQAVELNYEPPKQTFPGKLTYFLARDNQYKSSLEDTRLNWKTIAAEFEVHVIPGRHDTIREEPYVGFLAEKLTACIEKTDAKT
jgi:thioesterase domain-containing protein